MALIPLYIVVVFLAALLVLATVLQTLYMEAMRLRSRDTSVLVFFKEKLEDRIGVKGESGALAFSLIKHTLIVILTILVLTVSTRNALLSDFGLLESAAIG